MTVPKWFLLFNKIKWSFVAIAYWCWEFALICTFILSSAEQFKKIFKLLYSCHFFPFHCCHFVLVQLRCRPHSAVNLFFNSLRAHRAVSRQISKLDLLGVLFPLRQLFQYVFCLTIKNEFIFPIIHLWYDLGPDSSVKQNESQICTFSYLG